MLVQIVRVFGDEWNEQGSLKTEAFASSLVSYTIHTARKAEDDRRCQMVEW